MLKINIKATRSAVYRCFKRNKINKVPKQEKEKAKKFKEYQPSFLHIDVTYCPKKELNVKTPFLTITKWYELKSQIFKLKPCEFKNKLLSLTNRTEKNHQQPCET